jgi:hypothetical protein
MHYGKARPRWSRRQKSVAPSPIGICEFSALGIASGSIKE